MPLIWVRASHNKNAPLILNEYLRNLPFPLFVKFTHMLNGRRERRRQNCIKSHFFQSVTSFETNFVCFFLFCVCIFVKPKLVGNGSWSITQASLSTLNAICQKSIENFDFRLKTDPHPHPHTHKPTHKTNKQNRTDIWHPPNSYVAESKRAHSWIS